MSKDTIKLKINRRDGNKNAIDKNKQGQQRLPIQPNWVEMLRESQITECNLYVSKINKKNRIDERQRENKRERSKKTEYKNLTRKIK